MSSPRVEKVSSSGVQAPTCQGGARWKGRLCCGSNCSLSTVDASLGARCHHEGCSGGTLTFQGGARLHCRRCLWCSGQTEAFSRSAAACPVREAVKLHWRQWHFCSALLRPEVPLQELSCTTRVEEYCSTRNARYSLRNPSWMCSASQVIGCWGADQAVKGSSLSSGLPNWQENFTVKTLQRKLISPLLKVMLQDRSCNRSPAQVCLMRSAC